MGGYEAYERKFTVAVNKILGDIDEIIPFLEQSGEWVFSNESDKIYDVRQTVRIDFGALTRYRKADVVVTVQPIKRSALPAVTYAGFDWGDDEANELRIVNAGNTVSRPSFTFVFGAFAAGDSVFSLASSLGTFGITFTTASLLNSLVIKLDTLTGNATGTVENDQGVIVRTGYLTDMVTVTDSNGSTVDITALRLPAGDAKLTFDPDSSYGDCSSVTVADASSYI